MLRMMVLGYLFFFFFKQKTAYEMRISDWSSDVCSSDLSPPRRDPAERAADIGERAQGGAQRFAQGGVVVEQGDEIEPAVDRRPIHQRRGDILPQQPRARAGDGPIDRIEKTALALARRGEREFEAFARRAVDRPPLELGRASGRERVGA